MASWRVARSLDLLLAQVNDAAPKRSKRSDGSIGDARHLASGRSDHNPNSRGIVTARDYSHDPAGGLDCERLYQALVASRDPRIKYIIWNRTITSSYTAPWARRRYTGSNGHTQHLHLSVHGDVDSTRRWDLGALGGSLDLGDRVLKLTDPQVGGADVAEAAERLGLLEGAEFAYFGPRMDAAVKAYQAAQGLDVDGAIGPETVKALRGGTKAVSHDTAPTAAVPDVDDDPELPPRGYRWDGGMDINGRTTKGRHGGLVKWQARMRERGWKNSKGQPLAADGHWGKETERVVTLFQRAKGLKADGSIGEQTWNAAWTEEVR